MSARPTVSVIVPFVGTSQQLSELMGRLAQVALRPGDELIVADNRTGGGEDGATSASVRVIRAEGVSSPGFARNRAASAASGEWLVMIDADTEPSATLLDDYFEPLPAPRTAVLAGGVIDRAGPGAGIAARHSAGREQMNQRTTLERGPWSYAQSANVAVNRAAFVRVGGFDEVARAGEDADLCFRLMHDGYTLESRPHATVVHESRATVSALLEQLARHGAGAAWAQRRYPGSFPPPTVAGFSARIGRHLLRAAAAAARGRREAALGELLALAEACAFEGGRLMSNRPKRATYQ